MQFSDYQSLPSSEKVTLAVVNASKRLMGWVLHSGSIYKITGFTSSVVESIEDSGNAYTAVGSIVAVTVSKYYLDRINQILYLRTTGSDNPNSRLLVCNLKLFFANVPIVLPNDLASGFDVFWEPLVKSTSAFGVEIDTIAQTSDAIEGTGSLTLQNDFDFWPQYFDKYTFENQKVVLYSYHRELDPSDAHKIFVGRVEKKAYGTDTVVFQLKDQFAELRASLNLASIGDLGERTGDEVIDAKQRLILGRVFGHLPTNLDRILDGYPLTGTVSVTTNLTTVTGSGTLFLKELSPDDQLNFNGIQYTVATIASNTSLELTQEYMEALLTGYTVTVTPDQPKRYINREFLVAGHSLREPTTTAVIGSTINRLKVVSTADFYPGNKVYIGALGSGELATVESIIGLNYLKLSTSLSTVPVPGTVITRPSVQNVRIDSTELLYYRDYTFDASTARLVLREDAEANASATFQLTSNVVFTNASRTVTGTGFRGVLKPSYMLGMVGHTEFFEIQSIESDTSLTLRTTATFSATAHGLYKSLVFDDGTTILSLDTLGRTDDDTPSGNLLVTAPLIARTLLNDAGLASEINSSSFDAANEIAYQHLGLVIPSTFDDSSVPTYRDVLNQVNKSAFGAIVQNADFKFTYEVLRPNKPTTATKFSESDILSFSLVSSAENIAGTVIIEYHAKEYDYTALKPTINTQQRQSDNAVYLIRTDVSRTITTILVDETDADIMAARWSFLLSNSSARLTVTTKLQGSTLEIGDIIEIEHRKFFERFGSSGKRKLLMVESVKRDGSQVTIVATDLSNTFNRVATINDNIADWTTATETEHLYGGYITDQYGLINNDPTNFETNLIW